MVRIQYDANEQFKITLPKQLVKAKGWRKGDELYFELDEKGNLVLKKEEK
jgi:bifunctional DNA-binding transcriptional regulator/antitoxin component of YhaV-PrlF toxin-antitoxin module